MGTSGVGRGHGSGSYATRFRPGHPGRKGAKRGETGPPPGQPMPNGLLRALRAVMARPESEDRTPFQTALRGLLQTDPLALIKLVSKAEADYEKSKRAARRAFAPRAGNPSPPATKLAPPAEPLDQLMARLLAECAAPDPPLRAARPDPLRG